MPDTFTLLGFTLPWYYAAGGLALVCLILGYLAGASFSTRRVTVASRKDRKRPVEDPEVLRGINSMLANDTDKAISELSRAVERSPESVETYIALGHLFRTKGQFDRAVAIRQSIIARANLPREIRLQAVYDMGVDYRQGGFLSRAIEAFEQVLAEDARHLSALKELIAVYQEMGRWDDALEAQRKLLKYRGKSDNALLARLKTERGKQLAGEGRLTEAAAAFKKALSWDSACVDAMLSLGDLYLAEDELKKALAAWRKIGEAAPHMAYLALDRVTGRPWGAREAGPVNEFIAGLAEESKDPRAQLIAARHLAARGLAEETRKTLAAILAQSACYLPAHRDLGQLLLERGNVEAILAGYRSLVDCLPGPEAEYQCRRCGFTAPELYWQCPSCRVWDSMWPAAGE